MEIVSVVDGGDRVSVVTTGGVFEIGPSRVTLVRRIDPAINDVAPRPVARIEFERQTGPFTVGPVSKRSCIINGRTVSFDVRGDSMVFLSNVCTEPVTYTFKSLAADAPWCKGRGADRMWAGLSGGSLHLSLPKSPVKVTTAEAQSLTVIMPPDRRTAFSVFPPKIFDFEKLYGADARPHCFFVYRLEDPARRVRQLAEAAKRGFGVIVLFESLYDLSAGKGVHGGVRPTFNTAKQRFEYRYADSASIERFIKEAHDLHFKVITYFKGSAFKTSKYARPEPGAMQKALAFMREFQQRYKLDGWYFDNASLGDWLLTYDFIRKVREDIGDEGIIYHHDSIDVWGHDSGLVMVQVDAYVNYTLKGECGVLAEQTHHPNDPFFAFYTGGYGLSQAVPCHKPHIRGRAAITRADTMRLAGQNLNGSERATWSLNKWTTSADWDEHFAPYFALRKKQYLLGDFSPAVSWPPSWYHEADNVQVETPSSTTARITWEAGKWSTGSVSYTTAASNNLRDHRSEPKHAESGRHVTLLSDLKPGTTYRFAIRSHSRGNLLDREVWGYVGSFATPEREGKRSSPSIATGTIE